MAPNSNLHDYDAFQHQESGIETIYLAGRGNSHLYKEGKDRNANFGVALVPQNDLNIWNDDNVLLSQVWIDFSSIPFGFSINNEDYDASVSSPASVQGKQATATKTRTTSQSYHLECSSCKLSKVSSKSSSTRRIEYGQEKQSSFKVSLPTVQYREMVNCRTEPTKSVERLTKSQLVRNRKSIQREKLDVALSSQDAEQNVKHQEPIHHGRSKAMHVNHGEEEDIQTRHTQKTFTTSQTVSLSDRAIQEWIAMGNGTDGHNNLEYSDLPHLRSFDPVTVRIVARRPGGTHFRENPESDNTETPKRYESQALSLQCDSSSSASSASYRDSAYDYWQQVEGQDNKQRVCSARLFSVLSHLIKMTDRSRNHNASKWRTAVDPKSGKTYYYHVETRETQWRKPMELASAQERMDMEEKERRQREFFAAMEANILNSISAGAYTAKQEDIKLDGQRHPAGRQNVSLQERTLSRPNLVRTISAMDETLLRDLVKRVPSYRNVMSVPRTRAEIAFSPNDRSQTTMFRHVNSFKRDSSGLLSISEVVQENNSAEENNGTGLQEDDEYEEDVAKDKSFRSLLSALPEEGEKLIADCFYGSTSATADLDESAFHLGLSAKESRALQKLAALSDEMAHVPDDYHLEYIEEGGEDDSERSGTERSMGGHTEMTLGDEIVFKPDISSDDDRNLISRVLPNGAADTFSLSKNSAAAALSEKPQMVRRNTCGTLYVASTMAAPDKDATIKCVCGVYRAHILQSEMEDDGLGSHEYRHFNDLESQQKPIKNQFRPSVDFVVKPPPPTLEEITTFYRDVFRRAQMEADCIIMSLIYVERLIKCTKGALRPRTSNWRSILFSCMVLSSKVWDDMSMWNADFSETCPAGVKFSLQRINELEVAVLSALNYKVKVPASEYAKYYFLLRSMLIKSGLGGDDFETMSPLDVEGARRLQQVSSLYQNAATEANGSNNLKGKHLSASRSLSVSSMGAINSKKITSSRRGSLSNKVGLEHLVKM